LSDCGAGEVRDRPRSLAKSIKRKALAPTIQTIMTHRMLNAEQMPLDDEEEEPDH